MTPISKTITHSLWSALLLLSCRDTVAQMNGASQQGTRAQQLSLSERQQNGSVSAQQSTVVGGGSSSSNTINTSIQVQGNYQGSVADPTADGSPLALTLDDAIKRGLQFNLGSVSASTSLRQVRAQRLSALSSLLPNINGSLSYTEQKSNLQAQGLSADTLGSLGAAFPKTVGPYHYYDVRGTASQTLFDATAWHNYKEAKELEKASELSQQDASELVIMAVGGEYLRTLADIALVQSQEAQVKYSEASYKQAAAQNTAGTKSRVDTQRSLVQLQTEQQRLASARADLDKQKLTLVRLLGLPLRTQVTFAEALSFHEQSVLAVDDAIQRGTQQRADLHAAEVQLRAAEQALKASRSEYLPSASVNGYYGIQGLKPNGGNGVFGVTGTINVPIWRGGQTRADVEQARAVIDQRRAEYQDQRGQVELEVRNAYIDLEVATNQVKVAESNRKLALDTLEQSQDRFAEGVTDSVEVVQSQESLATAEHDYINSLYSHNLAKISLARAMGELQRDVSDILKGNQP